MNEEIDEPKILQKESIKLTHNTKGYTWEVKLFVENGDLESLNRLDKINNELLIRYGGVSNE